MQVALRGCDIILLGDIQKQEASGHGPGQLALGGPACVQGLDQMTSRSAFQHYLFYDFVIFLRKYSNFFIKMCHFKYKPTTSI